jgi:hypothetical protein
MTTYTTYEGPVGRVVGFLWGSVWAGFGTLISTILIVRGDLFSRSLQDTIVDLAPWLDANPTGVIGTEGAIVGGLFAVFCLGYGLYHLGRVFLVSDYSITFTRGRHTGNID